MSPVDGLLRVRETSGLVGLTLGPGDVSMYGVAPPGSFISTARANGRLRALLVGKAPNWSENCPLVFGNGALSSEKAPSLWGFAGAPRT